MTEDADEPKWQRKRRYPKILADEVRSARRGADHLGQERTKELLKLYRIGRLQMIADMGITGNSQKKIGYFNRIPTEHFNAIRQLDIALEKLHKYDNGGARDYAAADVERYMRSELARLPRKRESAISNDEIAGFLRKRNYETSDDKKAIVQDAMEHFDLGERKIRSVAKEYGLTKSKKTTAR